MKRSKGATGGGIYLDAAYTVLKAMQRYMDNREITSKAQEMGLLKGLTGKTPHHTMASALYTDVKKKVKGNHSSLFIRPQEGIFGLREWEGDSSFELTPTREAPCQENTSPLGKRQHSDLEELEVPASPKQVSGEELSPRKRVRTSKEIGGSSDRCSSPEARAVPPYPIGPDGKPMPRKRGRPFGWRKYGPHLYEVNRLQGYTSGKSSELSNGQKALPLAQLNANQLPAHGSNSSKAQPKEISLGSRRVKEINSLQQEAEAKCVRGTVPDFSNLYLLVKAAEDVAYLEMKLAKLNGASSLQEMHTDDERPGLHGLEAEEEPELEDEEEEEVEFLEDEHVPPLVSEVKETERLAVATAHQSLAPVSPSPSHFLGYGDESVCPTEVKSTVDSHSLKESQYEAESVPLDLIKEKQAADEDALQQPIRPSNVNDNLSPAGSCLTHMHPPTPERSSEEPVFMLAPTVSDPEASTPTFSSQKNTVFDSHFPTQIAPAGLRRELSSNKRDGEKLADCAEKLEQTQQGDASVVLSPKASTCSNLLGAVAPSHVEHSSACSNSSASSMGHVLPPQIAQTPQAVDFAKIQEAFATLAPLYQNPSFLQSLLAYQAKAAQGTEGEVTFIPPLNVNMFMPKQG
mmetsp:Transcript_11295/g.13340  ORF Transcript_11295/g.13340 Transcript_11295/m.13340 type:complete len:630 (-) Transcript_11295:559-2448(-)|eukprot:CAMPEP_0197866278 /NCGR_PEP_ID=MMETSP1438-20131217/44129_1 /TAXON_ID=1461541 /ORGANISM="Pterosperma sp., Strain CCMP1384" /LENGTH=629 /DNA_ID=CAMNT_0043484835 /DNA_START=435 /DNA_END=2324 /DNA_ORIENTATION=+